MNENTCSPFRPDRGHTSAMRLLRSDTSLTWGELDLPVMGMDSDWHGAVLNPPLCYAIATDSSNLWFVATRQASATCRPDAEPGSFTERLWEYDVAELFLADPASGAYLEFNLAPNGAWWAAKFTAPRIPAGEQPHFQSTVASHWSDVSDGVWCAALRVPLDFLEKEIRFGIETTANATAILNSPHQTFHSAHKLTGTNPDFHQPSSFVRFTTILP